MWSSGKTTASHSLLALALMSSWLPSTDSSKQCKGQKGTSDLRFWKHSFMVWAAQHSRDSQFQKQIDSGAGRFKMLSTWLIDCFPCAWSKKQEQHLISQFWHIKDANRCPGQVYTSVKQRSTDALPTDTIFRKDYMMTLAANNLPKLLIELAPGVAINYISLLYTTRQCLVSIQGRLASNPIRSRKQYTWDFQPN